MSQAEELLNNLSVHEHDMADSDAYFVINPKSRQIDHFSRTQNVIMQGDHKSELYTFQLPRYVEGHDMLLCNRVRVHYNNIEAETGKENADVYEMTDLHVNPDDPETVISSWEIHKQATQLVGILSFLVQYECVDSNGESTYEWHTDFYDDVVVKKTKHNGEAAVVEYSDILEQWYTRLFGTGESVIADITEAAEQAQEDLVATRTAQVEAIRLKGEETLATIPEDYTATYNMAEEALRRKAAAIVLEADCETISIDDASDSYLLGLKLYGKTKQNTTTGAQLIRTTLSGQITVSGLTVTPTGTGNLIVNGTHTNTAMWLEFGRVSLTAGKTYTLTCSEGFSIHLWDATNNKEYRTKKGDVTSLTIEPAESIECAVVLNDAVLNRTYANVLVDALLIEGSTIVPWEPYTGGLASPNPDYPQSLVSVENPTVKLSGKNLLEFNFPTATNAGISYTLNNDGSLTINGTATELSYYTFCFGNEIPVYGTDVTISLGNNNGKVTLTVGYFKENGETVNDLAHVVNGEVTFSYPREAKTTRTFIVVSAGAVCDNLTVYPMMRLANMTSDFEMVKQQQSMNITRTLPGIPVTSGGNYTDSNSQQWICDEVDFVRGVYVQRVALETVTGTPNFSETSDSPGRFIWLYALKNNSEGRNKGLSNFARWINWGIGNNTADWFCTNLVHLYYYPKNPMTAEEVNAKFAEMIASDTPPVVLTQLVTPIETPLTYEEIAAYKKLATNYHDTVVVNDQNAHMSIAYAADTKLYIDKRINEALKAASHLS